MSQISELINRVEVSTKSSPEEDGFEYRKNRAKRPHEA